MRSSKSALISLLALLPPLGCLAIFPATSVFADEDETSTSVASDQHVHFPLRAEAPPPAAPTPDPEALAQASTARTSYQQAITQLEARQGVYGTELSEAYMGLGTTSRTLGLHVEAAEAFGKALQSLRISQGLYDARQLPVLEELRATNETLRNWPEVDAANHLIFYIAKRNAEADKDLRVRSLVQLARWIRRAEQENLVSDFTASTDDVTRLYNNEIAYFEALEPYDGRNVHLASLYLDLAATELSEAKRKYELPISEFQTPGAGEQRTTTQQTCISGVDRNGRPVVACTAPMEVPNINYYLAPNVQKNTEIRAHLSEVENRVVAAFNTLQEEPATTDQQTDLLTEVQRLTTEYNAFVSINRSR